MRVSDSTLAQMTANSRLRFQATSITGKTKMNGNTHTGTSSQSITTKTRHNRIMNHARLHSPRSNTGASGWNGGTAGFKSGWLMRTA